MPDLDLKEDDVWLYLTAVLGEKPAVDKEGQVTLECPFRSHPGFLSYVIPAAGRWYCPAGCARGDLAIYEWGRSRVAYLRQAQQSVLKIIEAEKQKNLMAEKATLAARYSALEGLQDSAKRLFGMIARNRGQARRYYQQGSHMNHREFRNGLRELLRRGLISKKTVPATGRRRRVCYFSVVAGKPPTGSMPDEGVSC